jgi:peroxiredoxin
VSPQDILTNQALQERRSLPFPILADSDQTVIRSWGIFNHDDPKSRAIPHPSTYLVASDGQIAWAHVGSTARDRPESSKVISELERLMI